MSKKVSLDSIQRSTVIDTGGNDAVVLPQGKYYAEDTFPTNSKS